MAAAGMAYADRFPRIVFNLTGGWENDDVSGFFRSPFSYVAGTLASPIFGFGRKQAGTRPRWPPTMRPGWGMNRRC